MDTGAGATEESHWQKAQRQELEAAKVHLRATALTLQDLAQAAAAADAEEVR